jgi:precorrin-2/cobalt-factor-2 C20-methyltransferase
MTETSHEQTKGTLYGIGVGPGDPELLTLKAARILRNSPCIYLPTSRLSTQSYVTDVVQHYANSTCEICPVTFFLAADSDQRREHWQQTADEIAERLRTGQDVAFVTLGDTLLYSTYIYLLRALRMQYPEARVETVPGISSFSLAAALTNMPLGEGSQSLQIIPSANDFGVIEKALADGGGVVLMKIGRYLQEIIGLLDRLGTLHRSVFVSRAGLPDQRVETDLNLLRGADEKVGNLAVIIVQGSRS